jgi:hypothetical protein
MRQQIDRLQSAMAKPVEESSPQPQNLTEPLKKGLQQLVQAQQILRSTILFWHLKEKILSGTPYVSELNAYKAHTISNEDISSLKEYASQGLRILKEPAKEEAPKPSQLLLPPDKERTDLTSWWQRLQTSVKSLISIEKVEASHPLPVPTDHEAQNQRSIEAIKAILARLEQMHIHQLTAISLPDLTASPEGDQP